MKKYKKTLITIWVFISVTIIPILGQSELIVYSSTYEPISYPSEMTSLRENDEYEFKVKIPKNWNMYTAFTNKDNNPDVIIKRTIFENEGDRIILDIWNSNQLSLEENHSRLEEIFLVKKVSRKSNGKVNGLDAVLASNLEQEEGNLPHLSVFFQTKKYIYRVNYPVTSSEGIEKFLTFISNFKIRGREKIEDYSLKSLELPAKKNVISFDFINKVYAADTCGGYTMQGNNFPCCSSGGNCTWWAIYKRQDLKDKITWGNAGPDWIKQANQTKLPIYTDPIEGSIAVWGPKDGRSGHVAYVNYKTSATQFSISEMNCSGSAAPGPRDVNVQKNYSDYWVLDSLGFIGNGSSNNTNLTIQNQTLNQGTYSATNQVNIIPESILRPLSGDIIVKIQ